ncbi:MAG: ribonuclease P protein component [Alphaproteobacteria bacterium]
MSKNLGIENLKTRSQYLAVAKVNNKKVTTGLVVQYLAATDETAPARVGLTVSGKTGGSVDRSRIKRRLRQVIKEILPGAARPGATYVVIGRRAALNRPFDSLKKDLQTALKALHTSKPPKDKS